MPGPMPQKTAAARDLRRLFFFNLGFLRQRRLRRILQLAGYSLHIGLPKSGDGVVVWGKSPTSRRGEVAAAKSHAPLIRIEDAFLRSVRPGRMGDAPIGLMIDTVGVHFDASGPSLLENILVKHPLDDTVLLARARDGIARLRALDLSKYNLHSAPAPTPGYVLVIDQTLNDAAIVHSGADASSFRAMLAAAMDDHPNARIVIKTHPETALGLRRGHFGAADAGGRVSLMTQNTSPWDALDGAIAVYTVSSQMGFEAILSGHRPNVFGQPFYAGWGLTTDAAPHPRRKRRLTKTQIFAAAMILAPTWYDPHMDRLCSFEQAVDTLQADLRSHRLNRGGHIAIGMRLWKRGWLQAMFGREVPLIFQNNPEKAAVLARKRGRSLLVWAGKEPADLPSDLAVLRIEDGFLRSNGLGARLVPPLSLVADDLGIYYDPTRPSRLEHLIAAPIPADARARAQVFLDAICAANLSKYNLDTGTPDLPPHDPARPRILVPGQVEDDASIRLAAGNICTNLGLLRAARTAYPQGFLIYKPHPDVEAGLRIGAICAADLAELADLVAVRADPIALIHASDAVFTMTSTIGFEALLRGKPVTCTGAPFYAGWGLTHDLGDIPARRAQLCAGKPRPDLLQLVHAALIAYPLYFDPARPCPPEVALQRLIAGQGPKSGPAVRLLAKVQGRSASLSYLWR